MKLKSSILFFSLAFMVLPSISSAFDEDIRWYQVEVIIFESFKQSYGAEDWKKNSQLADIPDNTVFFAPNLLATEEGESLSKRPDITYHPIAKPIAREQSQVVAESNSLFEEEPLPDFEMMEDEAYYLSKQIGRLIDSDAYQPLVHLSWKQPLGTETRVPLFITEGLGIDLDQLAEEHRLAMEERLDNAEADTEESPLDPIEEETIEIDLSGPSDLGPSLPRLHGTVTLTRGRYLHFETNLSLLKWIPKESALGVSASEEMGDASREEGELIPIRFVHNEKRRLKREEIHYLDHPVIGVILRVVHATAPLHN